jgi:hypothetical protein
VITQLALFQEPASTPVRAEPPRYTAPPPIAAPVPAQPAVGHFYVGGFRIARGDPRGIGGPNGWKAARFHEEGYSVGGYALRPIRVMYESWARNAGLPLDLYARGWERYPAPNGHWLLWRENGVSCCRWPTLEENAASARTMRPLSELRAWAEARRREAERPKRRTRRKAA